MCDSPAPVSLVEHFRSVPDPRIHRTRRHNVIDIIVIAVLAVLCGAEDFVSIEMFGKSKRDWLSERLELPNGIPSHDTFARVFARLDPEAFQRCFLAWVEALRERATIATTRNESIALDGKTLRHSFDTATGQASIHMVSAWATTHGLVLGQMKVNEKSNEITAIPQILKLLDIAGCIVTIDAMGCQKAIARQIHEQRGEYVLALKDNQPSLAEGVNLFLEHAEKDGYKDLTTHSLQNVEKDHGRIETRQYRLIDLPEGIAWRDERALWPGIKSIGVVTSTRQIRDKTTTHTRIFISSLSAATKRNALRFSKAVRSHWGIENSLHWVLDMSYAEDACRIRKEHAAQNFAIVRHITLNLLKLENTAKAGVKNKRLKAGWDNCYLERVLMPI